MKRLVLFLGITILASAITWALKAQQSPPEKKYKVEQSIEWWSRSLNSIEATKNQLKQSDLPSKNVVYLIDSLLTPIQLEMTRQIQDQLNAEQAAHNKKDSTIKNKRN